MKDKLLLAEEGFSLTEILVVIVIIGILVLIALPQFTNVIGQAKSTEAKLSLKHLHTLQLSYFYQNDRYADNLAAIGFEQSPLLQDGGNARYRIEIVEASMGDYLARATSVVDADRDGVYNTWEVGASGTVIETIPE